MKELTGHKLKDLQFTILKVRTAHSASLTYNLVGRPWINKDHPGQLSGFLFIYTLSGNRIRKITPETCVCAASLQRYWIKSCTSPVNQTSRTIVSVCKQDNVPIFWRHLRNLCYCYSDGWGMLLKFFVDPIFRGLHVYREYLSLACCGHWVVLYHLTENNILTNPKLPKIFPNILLTKKCSYRIVAPHFRFHMCFQVCFKTPHTLFKEHCISYTQPLWPTPTMTLISFIEATF